MAREGTTKYKGKHVPIAAQFHHVRRDLAPVVLASAPERKACSSVSINTPNTKETDFGNTKSLTFVSHFLGKPRNGLITIANNARVFRA